MIDDIELVVLCLARDDRALPVIFGEGPDRLIVQRSHVEVECGHRHRSIDGDTLDDPVPLTDVNAQNLAQNIRIDRDVELVFVRHSLDIATKGGGVGLSVDGVVAAILNA